MVAQQCEWTKCPCTVHLKIVKMVDFMLGILSQVFKKVIHFHCEELKQRESLQSKIWKSFPMVTLYMDFNTLMFVRYLISHWHPCTCISDGYFHNSRGGIGGSEGLNLCVLAKRWNG